MAVKVVRCASAPLVGEDPLVQPKGRSLVSEAAVAHRDGERRIELSLLDIYEAYLQRYDLEHFFRFGKQKLLLDKFQTPDDQHEEH